MSINTEICLTAKKFVGKREIKGNKGFFNKAFDTLMRSVGFKTGHAWCSYFAELVWTEAYKDDKPMLKLIKKQFSGSSYRTLQRFKALGMVSDTATPGSIVIWRRKKDGKYTTLGHVGIVIKADVVSFETVEGNTNGAGSREGDVVADKVRPYDWEVRNGLELAGFIHPIEHLVVAKKMPFTNKAEGDKFRAWVNDVHPAIAKEIDLDRSGSYNNAYISKAWSKLHNEYKN